MTIFHRLRSVARWVFRRSQVERELRNELDSFIELSAADKIRDGANPEEARRLARLEIRGVEQTKERVRFNRWGAPLDQLWQDLRYALRTLRKSPGFATVIVATLALGIGATTGMYSIAHAVMFRPLSLPDPQDLVRIYEANPSRNLLAFSASGPNYASWRQYVHGLELAAFISVACNWTGDGEPQRLDGIAATSSFLRVAGPTVQLGRWFSEEEERPGQQYVVVLSDSFWKRQFAQDDGVLGRKIILNAEPHTIIGVARSDLAIPVRPDLWIPRVLDANRGNRFLYVIGRLNSGVTLENARAELSAIARDLESQFPATNKGWGVAVVPLMQWLIPPEVRTTLSVLLAAVAMILLIACANLANLQLARAESRRKEIAVRLALGAGARRIARQLMTESMLLSLSGGGLAVLIAAAIARAARNYLAEIVPRVDQVSLDLNVLVFALALTLLTALLFGAAPIGQVKNMRLEALQQMGRSSQPTARRQIRSVLVAGQVAIATLLLIGAALLLQSLARLQATPLGFNADSVLTARIPLPGAKYGINGAYARFLDQLTEGLRSTSGVLAAGVSNATPLGPGSSITGVAAVLPSDSAAEHSVACGWRSVDRGFFETLSIPLIRGRLFNTADDGARRVFVLSQELARALFGDQDPVGRQLRLNDAAGEVIGIVGDLRLRNISDPPDRIVYVPISQGGLFGVFSVFVRTNDRPETAAPVVRERLREIDPNLPAFSLRPQSDWVSNNSARARIRTWVLVLLAAIALGVGTIGIYGVLSYLVSLRSHEFGVRVALGANPRNLLMLVLLQGLGLALIGTALGLLGAFLLARLMETLLFGVSASDPVTYLVITVLLLLAALLACALPARRAARTDPIMTIRSV
jgi:putative ABC transport system permease protein